jgi:putative ABC transport system ATP-binding protein
MIRLQNVSKVFQHRKNEVAALRPISLEIGAGEFVAVVGPSGSGKTTLLSVLGGMLAPSTGQVWLDGRSLYDANVVERAKLRQQKIGFVFQTFNLIPYLTAAENVQVPLMLAGSCTADQQKQVVSLLARVGLECRMDHKPSELSVGQQQRVALARTLISNPAVILADEPTGNLDPETREHVLHFFETLAREGRTVIMVTHDPAAASRAERVIALRDGCAVTDTKKSTTRVA